MTVIKLNFHRQDFEEFYFKNRQGNIFLSPAIKQRFIILLVFTTGFIASLIYYLFTNEGLGLTIIFFLVFTMAAFDYYRYASPILKWKRSVAQYLTRLSAIKNHEINITTSSIAVIEDGEETIQTWASFTKAIISEEAITLFSKEIFLFPKKSMEESEYEYLKSIVANKLKEGI